jgi:hypothetical protein
LAVPEALPSRLTPPVILLFSGAGIEENQSFAPDFSLPRARHGRERFADCAILATIGAARSEGRYYQC